MRKVDSTSSAPKKLGQLTVHAEECVTSKTSMELVFRCMDLENKEIFSKSVWTFLIILSWKLIIMDALIHFMLFLVGPFSSNFQMCGEWAYSSSL